MEDLIAIARATARSQQWRAGNRFSLDELESAAFFGMTLALRDYDESKGHIRAYVRVRAYGEVLSEIRDRHPNGSPGGLRTHCAGVGHEDELTALSGVHAAPEPDLYSIPKLLRDIRQKHSPRDAAIVAIAMESGSYDYTARVLGITTQAVYLHLRLIRRGDIGRALAKSFGFDVTPTGALERM